MMSREVLGFFIVTGKEKPSCWVCAKLQIHVEDAGGREMNRGLVVENGAGENPGNKFACLAWAQSSRSVLLH